MDADKNKSPYKSTLSDEEFTKLDAQFKGDSAPDANLTIQSAAGSLKILYAKAGRSGKMAVTATIGEDSLTDTIQIINEAQRKGFIDSVVARWPATAIVRSMIEAELEKIAARWVNRSPLKSAVSAPDAKPEVIMPGGSTPINESATKLGALLAANGEHYMRGGATVRLVPDDEGAPVLNVMKPAALASVFETVAQLQRYETIDGEVQAVPTICSETTARLILHSQAFIERLPVIRVVTRCPVLVERADGSLVQVAGYDRESGVFADGKAVEEMSLKEACALLLDMLSDFRFATESDQSRAIAAVITPAMAFGGLLPGRAALDLGEADDSQAGKGYRNKVTGAIYRQKITTITERKGGVGSLEETFNSALIRGSSFIAIDNVRGKINSPAIESYLTEDWYLAREPYGGNVGIDPRRTVLMMTSNRAEITPDLANRSSCVRILKQPADHQFKVFPEGDLLDHVRAHWRRYLGAVFTVVRAWHAAGKPRTREARHDFRGWAQALDWIVQTLVGCAPLLDGHQETQRRMTTPALGWLRDLAIAVGRAGRLNTWLRAHDLLDVLATYGVDIPGAKDEGANLDDESNRGKALRAIGRRMGQCFQEAEAMQIDNITIERRETADVDHRTIREYRFSTTPPRHAPAMTPPCAPPSKHANPAYPASVSNIYNAETKGATSPEICSIEPMAGMRGNGGDQRPSDPPPTGWGEEGEL